MRPDAATAWEDGLSRYENARGACLKSGGRRFVVAECQNAICSACCAIKLAGFGDPWATLSRLRHSLPPDPYQAIGRTREILRNLRRMAPDEDPFPDVGS
jgi:hypothetical protein